MQSEPENPHYATAAALLQTLHSLADQLDDLIGLIKTGNYAALAELVSTAAWHDLTGRVAAARTAKLALTAAPSVAGDPATVMQLQAALNAAQQRLTLSTATMQALTERGLLFTQTMLTAIGATAGYGHSGRAELTGLPAFRGEA